MKTLNTEANFTDADTFYAKLMDLYKNADAELSERINTRLILLLSNHIGDLDILLEAINIAGEIGNDEQSPAKSGA